MHFAEPTTVSGYGRIVWAGVTYFGAKVGVQAGVIQIRQRVRAPRMRSAVSRRPGSVDQIAVAATATRSSATMTRGRGSPSWLRCLTVSGCDAACVGVTPTVRVGSGAVAVYEARPAAAGEERLALGGLGGDVLGREGQRLAVRPAGCRIRRGDLVARQVRDR
jgi:hypothetical protein